MNDVAYPRVRAAAAAAWITFLLAVLYVCLMWLGYMACVLYKPDWIIALCGGGMVDWEFFQRIAITIMAVMKLILITWLFACMWLSLWGRRLKRL